MSLWLLFLLYESLTEKAVGACNLLSIALNDIVCTLYLKTVLILLLLEAGDIERNPGPNTINNSLSLSPFCIVTFEVYVIN